MKELFRDGDSEKLSASRAPMLVLSGLLLALWVGIGVGIAFFEMEWSDFSGWFTWGRDFFFGTVIAFVGGKAAGRIKNGSSGARGDE